MNAQFEWFNDQIDRMQANKSLLATPAPDAYRPSAEEVAMLQFAAGLNSLRPKRPDPDPVFLRRLGECVLAAVEEG